MEIKLIDGQNVWRCPLEICMETKHWILVMAGETQRFSNSAIYKKTTKKNQKEKTQRKQQNTPEAPLVTAVLYRVAFALLFV